MLKNGVVLKCFLHTLLFCGVVSGMLWIFSDFCMAQREIRSDLPVNISEEKSENEAIKSEKKSETEIEGSLKTETKEGLRKEAEAEGEIKERTEFSGRNSEIEKAEDNDLNTVPYAFRRVYVPTELVESLPNSGVAYWPIEAEKFERWVRAVESEKSRPKQEEGELIPRSAYYCATFDNNMLINGMSLINLCSAEECILSDTIPKNYVWHFRSGNFALDRVVCMTEAPFQNLEEVSVFAAKEYKPNMETPEMENVSFLPDGTGEMKFPHTVINQQKESTVFMQWTQKNSLLEKDRAIFDLHFFSALDTTFDIFLPKNQVPVISHGLRECLGEFSHEERKMESFVLWRFHLGGNHRVKLVVMSRDSYDNIYPVKFSQKNWYKFQKTGLDVLVRMSMDAFLDKLENERENNSPQFYKVRVDSRLILTEVTYNREPVKWRYLENDGKNTRNGLNLDDGSESEKEVDILLEFPQEVRGEGNILEFRAIENPLGGGAVTAEHSDVSYITENQREEQFIVPGTVQAVGVGASRDGKQEKRPILNCAAGNRISAEREMSLPKIRMLNAFWSEGKTVVLTEEPIQVTDIYLEKGQILFSDQEKTLAKKEKKGDVSEEVPLMVSLLEVEEFSQDASLKLHLTVLQEKIFVKAVTLLNFQQTDISATAEFHFSSKIGEKFLVGVPVDSRWIIDSVESVTPGMIQDWRLDEMWEKDILQSRNPESQQKSIIFEEKTRGMNTRLLRVNLVHAVRPGHDLKLRVRARRLGVLPREEFTSGELIPFPFHENQEQEQEMWMIVGTSFSWELCLSDEYQKWQKEIYELNFSQNKSVHGISGEPVDAEKSENMSSVVSSEINTFPDYVQEFLARQKTADASDDFLIMKRIPEQDDMVMLQVAHRPSVYTAEIKGFYDLTWPPQSKAVFTVMCTPKNSSVERVLVYINPATYFDLTWKFPEYLEGSVVRCIEKVTKDENIFEENSFEIWEIVFASPRTRPFQFDLFLFPPDFSTLETAAHESEYDDKVTQEIGNSEKRNISAVGNQKTELLKRAEKFLDVLRVSKEGIPLNLISLPEAEESTAEVTLRRNMSGYIFPRCQRMTPLFFHVPSGDIPPGILWSFRYVPQMLESRLYSPQLHLMWKQEETEKAQTWIWNEEHQSQFFPGGVVLHIITWDIENPGATDFKIDMTDICGKDFHLLGVFMDGRRISGIKWGENVDNILKIQLPEWKSNTKVILQWIQKDDPLQILDTLKSRRPKTNLLTLNSTWKLWVPDNYAPIHLPWSSDALIQELSERKNKKEKEYTEPYEKFLHSENSVIYRFLGNMIFRGSFLQDTPSSLAAPENHTADIYEKSFLMDKQDWLSLVAISQQWNSANLEFHVGWTPFLASDISSFRVVHRSALEASRWFLLLVFFLIFSRYFKKYRAFRIFLCGASAAACLTVSPVFSPIFSGIFLGMLLSFALHSAQRHRIRIREKYPKVIRVFTPERVENFSTKTGQHLSSTSHKTVDFPVPIIQSNNRSPDK